MYNRNDFYRFFELPVPTFGGNKKNLEEAFTIDESCFHLLKEHSIIYGNYVASISPAVDGTAPYPHSMCDNNSRQKRALRGKFLNYSST